MPLFLLGRNPSLRILIVCNSDENARKRVGSIKRYIEADEDCKAVFPDLKPKRGGRWTEHAIDVEGKGAGIEPSLEAAGVNTSGTGSRKDVIIFDDVIDEDDANSEAVRTHRITQFEQVWFPRLEPNGFAIFICTAWHVQDLRAKLLTNPEWSSLVQSVTDDFTHIEQVVDNSERRLLPLWAERWNRELLLARRRAIGVRAFARGYQQRAYSDEDKFFKSYDKCVIRDGRVWSGSRLSWQALGVDRSWRFVQGVDLSTDARSGNVIVTIAVNPTDGRRVLVDVESGAWTSPVMAHKIKEKADLFRPDVIQVESNAYQVALLDWLKATFGEVGLPLRPFVTGRNKASEEVGLPSLEVEFENGAWVFPMPPDHTVDCSCDWCKLDRQLRDYPNCPENDHLMALWFSREGARLLGMNAEVLPTGEMTAQAERRYLGTGYGADEQELDEKIKEAERALRRSMLNF